MIPSFATAGVLTAPSAPLILSGYVPGNTLAAQHMNWYLGHLTLELNNLLTYGNVVQSASDDSQVMKAVRNILSIANTLTVGSGSGSTLSIPLGSSYGTVRIATGSAFTATLPSAGSALAASYEVDVRNENSGAGYISGSGYVTVSCQSGDYVAGFLNGTWQVTEQYGHVRLRPVSMGAGTYGWVVESCDGTVYRNVQSTTQTQASPVQNTWYNKGGSLTLPPGVYDISWEAVIDTITGGTGSPAPHGTLSTANNSESDVDLSAGGAIIGGGTEGAWPVYRKKRIVLAATTTYYLNIQTTQAAQASISFLGGTGSGNIIIEARRVG